MCVNDIFSGFPSNAQLKQPRLAWFRKWDWMGLDCVDMGHGYGQTCRSPAMTTLIYGAIEWPSLYFSHDVLPIAGCDHFYLR